MARVFRKGLVIFVNIIPPGVVVGRRGEYESLKGIADAVSLAQGAVSLTTQQITRRNMMKYAVVQKYFSSGHVEAHIKKVSDDTKSSDRELSAYDLYIDVFDTEEEARIFLREALEA